MWFIFILYCYFYFYSTVKNEPCALRACANIFTNVMHSDVEPDPDPGSQTTADADPDQDPDPVQTKPSWYFFMKNYFLYCR